MSVDDKPDQDVTAPTADPTSAKPGALPEDAAPPTDAAPPAGDQPPAQSEPPPGAVAKPAKPGAGLRVGPGVMAVIALLIIAGGLGALLVLYPWPPQTEIASFRAETGGRLDALETKIATIETLAADLAAQHGRLAALEGTASETRVDPDTVDRLAERLEAAITLAGDLAERIDTLEGVLPPEPGASTAPGAAAPGTARIEAGLADLESRLGALTTALDELRAAMAKRLATAEDALRQSEAAQDALARDLAQRPTAALISDALQRLAVLEQSDANAAVKRATLALATSALAGAVRDGGPFVAELAVVQGLAPGDGAVSQLAGYAETGVARPAALAARFPDSARAALSAERAAEVGGFWDWLTRTIAGLVTVRRTDGGTGAGAEDILARMQNALEAGDVAEAVASAEGLSKPAQDGLGPWLIDARARADADRALRSLQARVLDAVTPEPAGLDTTTNGGP